jgi:hypothetical protein
MGDRRMFSETSAPFSLMTYEMNIISAGSIHLASRWTVPLNTLNNDNSIPRFYMYVLYDE